MAEIRILCIGDPHFKENNKAETDVMHKKIVKKAKKVQPNYIVDMGDTLDRFKQVNEFALNRAVNFLRDLAEIAPVVVINGNHDRPSADDFLSPFHPFVGLEGTPNVKIVAQTLVIEDEKLNGKLVFVPYVAPGRFREALFHNDKLTAKEMSNVIAIFAHQEIKGCEYNGRISKDGDEWNPEWPFLCSGHIHNYQWLRSNVLYVGTPIQHDFGDLVKKSISLLTFKAGKNIPVEKRIYLGIRERQVIKMTGKEAAQWEYDDKYIWRITIVDTRANVDLFYLSQKYRELANLGVHFDENIVQKMSKISKKDLPTINAANFKKKLWKRIEDDEKQKQWLEICVNL